MFTRRADKLGHGAQATDETVIELPKKRVGEITLWCSLLVQPNGAGQGASVCTVTPGTDEPRELCTGIARQNIYRHMRAALRRRK